MIMGKDTGIKMVEKKIVSFISKSSVYTVSDLRKIFKDKKKEWSLPDSMNFQGFLEELKSTGLTERRFLDYNGLPFKTLYTLGDFDHFECACKLYKNAYLSHHTALFMNNLTEQIPKTIYVSYELSPKTGGTDKKLSQKEIDRSFTKPVREPQSFSFLRQEIVVHASKYNGNTGIVPHNTGNFSFTDTERTLIDSVVRPELSGGVFNVLNVFLTTKVFAPGCFIIFVIYQSAVVFDFLDALEPLTTLYLPLKCQNLLYFLPTTFFKDILSLLISNHLNY